MGARKHRQQPHRRHISESRCFTTPSGPRGRSGRSALRAAHRAGRRADRSSRSTMMPTEYGPSAGRSSRRSPAGHRPSPPDTATGRRPRWPIVADLMIANQAAVGEVGDVDDHEHHEERAEHRTAGQDPGPLRRASPPPTCRCRRGSSRTPAGIITKVTDHDFPDERELVRLPDEHRTERNAPASRCTYPCAPA